jgi:Arc/MetJ-type ribon-helix-helix transcriptional regulator
MMSENQLISKQYYEQFLSENAIAHPIRVLGDFYMEEQKNEVPELAYIRFAQGEVYFHNKDYEAAVFKWENIYNELEPWAKKNIADAFVKLELYQNAEEMYKSITTDSVLLNTEIGLQLFSLYKDEMKLDSAFRVIKKVVQLNPDYLNVTEMARAFFEEHHDWQSAIELVTSEAIRTKYLHWFDFLKGYVEEGHAKKLNPSILIKVLEVLYYVDLKRFENLITLVFDNYKNDFIWIEIMNELFDELKEGSHAASPQISMLFTDTYYNLMNGQFLIPQLNNVIPKLLTNWLKVTGSQVASAAILAWNDLFPTSLSPLTVNDAENIFHHSSTQRISTVEVIQFFDSIINWAKEKEVEILYDMNRLMDELPELRSQPYLLEELNRDTPETSIKQNYLDQDGTAKLLNFIRKAITDLLEKRVHIENRLTSSINWGEEMLAKLNGAIHQLEDLEEEKKKSIQKFYSELREEIRTDLMVKIPKLLRGCSDLILEDSDFKSINYVLNEEMNKRIQEYLQQTALPRFHESLTYWIQFSEEELRKSQELLDERSQGFNVLFGEERMKLECDFRVIEDWRRDANRLTSGINMDNVNILLKFTPTQFLLRSAGKLFSSISQNNTMLFNKYKSYVENENYEEVSNEIITKFLLQFDLFEKSLERDIKLFFKNPFELLNKTFDETGQMKEKNEASLTKMKDNPEMFRDPLTVFEIRLRQYEWMSIAGNNHTNLNN